VVGNTLHTATSRTYTGTHGRYLSFSFSQADSPGSTAHQKAANSNLNLDVGEMAKEMRDAVNRWFQDLEQKKNPAYSQNVEANLSTVARSSQPMFHATRQIRRTTSSP